MKFSTRALRTAACLASAVLTAGLPLSAGSITGAYAADEPYTDGSSGSLNYRKFSDHIEISGAKTDSDPTVIPSQIDGLPVTAIGMYAFQYSEMRSLELPDTLTVIDKYAFGYCKNLKSVTLPDSLKTMDLRTFEKCSALTEVNFPDHLVETGEFSFEETPWLDAQRQKDPLVIVNGALVDARTASGDVKVPSSVKYISPSAFSRNSKLTSVVLPSSVSKISDNAFWYCDNLTSAELNGATTMGFGVFAACNKLTDLKISGKLTKIDGYTFTDNSATATITFYGSESKWNSVEKPAGDPFLSRARMVFDENHQDPDEEVIGDINKDGNCDERDVKLLANWLTAVPKTNLADWKAGDMNKDQKLTAVDLSLLKRHILSA